MSDEKPAGRSPTWVKVLGVLITSLGGAIGSYQAARSGSKAESETNFQLIKQSVEHIQANQKMVWDVLMKEGKAPQPEPATIGPGSVGTIGRGAGSGTGSGYGRGRTRVTISSTTTSAPAIKPEPPAMDMTVQQQEIVQFQLPNTLDEAMKKAKK